MLKATLNIPSFVNTSGQRLQIEKSGTVLLEVLPGATSTAYSGEMNIGEIVKVDPAGGQSFSIPFSGVITNAAVLPMSFTPAGGTAAVVGSADAAEVTASYSGAFTKRNDKLTLGPAA